MATLTVGPTSSFPSIAAAMAAAGPNDTISLETGYSNETATVTHSGMIVTGGATSTGISLFLATGIPTFSLGGSAPINVIGASDGNGIVGNSGNNVVTVSNGVSAVDGGPGVDRLVVDFKLATGAITGNSTSNFSEAGGGGRTATITDGTFENFTVVTGSGADTLTVGNGSNVVVAGDGANTITAGNGANTIIGGNNADTITAGDGGNILTGGNGANIITSGGGNDFITSGTGADTIVAGGGDDLITVIGGGDTVNGGAGSDRLVVDYSAAITAVTGGITGGNFGTGYTAHIADLADSLVDAVEVEAFNVTTGSGNDSIRTGEGSDEISTGAGNDKLNGGGGADVLDGGSGFDFADYSTAFGPVLANVLDPSGNVGEAGGDRYVSIEGLIGSSFGDALRVGNSGASIWALAGDDTLFGGDGNDDLHGQGGNDKLLGGAGADALDGGDGTDFADYSMAMGPVLANLIDSSGNVGDAAGDQYASIEGLIGSAFDDTFQLGNGGGSIWALAGADMLFGGDGNDDLHGQGGNDKLFGSGGVDVLDGGAGDDVFIFGRGSAGGDTLVDFAGNGAAAGDSLVFSGYGTAGQGASFTQVDATHWSINSADGAAHDVLTFDNAPSIHTSDWLFV